MKVRFLKSTTMLPDGNITFNTKTEWLKDWAVAFSAEKLSFQSPEGRVWVFPINAVEYVEFDSYDEARHFGAEAGFFGFSEIGGNRIKTGNQSPESAGKPNPASSAASSEAESGPDGYADPVHRGSVREEGGDLHSTSGEDVRLPANNRRSRRK